MSRQKPDPATAPSGSLAKAFLGTVAVVRWVFIAFAVAMVGLLGSMVLILLLASR